jgi:hypothetical protein
MPANDKSDKPADAKPIIDVAHPGKSAPSDNSKSVIVRSRPLLKDPMMADNKPPTDAAAHDGPAETKPLQPAAKPNLKPPAAPSPETEKPTEPEESPPPPDQSPTPKDNDAQQAEAEAAEQAKRQAAIDKLAASKQYYLPINSVEKRRSKRFVIFGVLLSLLLIVAWADIALDAGLIHLGNVKAPTHFFSN